MIQVCTSHQTDKAIMQDAGVWAVRNQSSHTDLKRRLTVPFRFPTGSNNKAAKIAWLCLRTRDHVKIKHLHAHNCKYNTGWAGERERNEQTSAVCQQPFQLFIRFARWNEYSMKAPDPSLYVHFSLTLKIILLQCLQSAGKKWKMSYITLLYLCAALEIIQTCRILCDWFLKWKVEICVNLNNTRFCGLSELLYVNTLMKLYIA